MTDTMDRPTRQHAETDEQTQRARLGQDVILAGLEKGVDSKAVLTETLDVLGMTNRGYSDALGSLVEQGYVVMLPDQSGGVRFELTDKGRELAADDTRNVGKVYEVIQGVIEKNDALRQKGNQVLASVSLDPVELAS